MCRKQSRVEGGKEFNYRITIKFIIFLFIIIGLLGFYNKLYLGSRWSKTGAFEAGESSLASGFFSTTTAVRFWRVNNLRRSR